MSRPSTSGRSSCASWLLLLARGLAGCGPSAGSGWALRPTDQASELLVVRGPARGTALQVAVNSTVLTQTNAQELGLVWAGAGNTTGFGDLMDGDHQFWTG